MDKLLSLFPSVSPAEFSMNLFALGPDSAVIKHAFNTQWVISGMDCKHFQDRNIWLV